MSGRKFRWCRTLCASASVVGVNQGSIARAAIPKLIPAICQRGLLIQSKDRMAIASTFCHVGEGRPAGKDAAFESTFSLLHLNDRSYPIGFVFPAVQNGAGHHGQAT